MSLARVTPDGSDRHPRRAPRLEALPLADALTP